jgi:hypothetical protein
VHQRVPAAIGHPPGKPLELRDFFGHHPVASRASQELAKSTMCDWLLPALYFAWAVCTVRCRGPFRPGRRKVPVLTGPQESCCSIRQANPSNPGILGVELLAPACFRLGGVVRIRKSVLAKSK